MTDKILTCKMDKAGTDNNFLEELMVVLVIYKMEINESPAFKSLTTSLQSINQKTAIFIYDNSPNAQTHTHNRNWMITYRNDVSNPGVSKAYNEGFKCTKDQGKKWMLLADHDTVFERDFFLKCKVVVEENEAEKVFVPVMIDSKGIVSPFHFKWGRGVRLKNINGGKYLLTEKKFINSGLLISCELFELSGGFDEQFKLDFSDLAFIERLKSATKTFVLIDSRCAHSLFASKRTTLQESLERFNVYCQSANLFVKRTGDFWVTIWKYIRAVAFFCRYFDWRFITLAFAK